MKTKSAFLIHLFLIFSINCFSATGQSKYIILLIGDGMGLNHRTIAEYYLNAIDENKKLPAAKTLRMNKFPIQGISLTHSGNSYVTDSAAAGTALACGQKTYEGAIGVDLNKKPLESIAKKAKKRNMKVGIISSVSIDHATPAVFYANSESRSNYYEIAKQLRLSGFEFFGGGATIGEIKAKKKNLPSIHKMARAAGFREVKTINELKAIKKNETIWAYNHTLDEDAALCYAIDRPTGHITLAEFTEAAINHLENPEGFFLMVEGGRIDWAAHANDAKTVIEEVIDFDRAVEAAYKFYLKHPEETTIIVTADHETGGLALGNTDTGYALYPEKLASQTISGATFATMVQNWCRDGLSFEKILTKSRKYFDLENLSLKEEIALRMAYKQSMLPPEKRREKGAVLYGNREPFMIACLRVSNARAGLGWTTINHSASPVPVSAIGNGQELFSGYYDNTDIPKKLLQLMPAK
jgi:alkaline phosphatase